VPIVNSLTRNNILYIVQIKMSLSQIGLVVDELRKNINYIAVD